MRLQRRGVIYLLLILGFVGFVWVLSRNYNNFGTTADDASLAQLVQAGDQGTVKSAVLNASGDQVEWSDTHGKSFKTTIPAQYRFENDFVRNTHLNVKPQSSSNLLLGL